MPLDPLHAHVIAIAAALPEARTIALAGGGAMLAHGIVDRATKDVDLFTDRDSVEAVTVAAALRVALESAGFSIRPAPRPPHENRFVAVEPSAGAEVVVEVFPDGGRLHDPVNLGVGPVLHRGDLAADKTLAMWGRGEPRDFVDVVALLHTYSADDLVRLAGRRTVGSPRRPSPSRCGSFSGSSPAAGRWLASLLSRPRRSERRCSTGPTA